MESVLEKIRQARENETKRHAEVYPTETIIDGCSVKIRFSTFGDNKVIPAVQSMLIASYLDAALTPPPGGEPA